MRVCWGWGHRGWRSSHRSVKAEVSVDLAGAGFLCWLWQERFWRSGGVRMAARRGDRMQRHLGNFHQTKNREVARAGRLRGLRKFLFHLLFFFPLWVSCANISGKVHSSLHLCSHLLLKVSKKKVRSDADEDVPTWRKKTTLQERSYSCRTGRGWGVKATRGLNWWIWNSPSNARCLHFPLLRGHSVLKITEWLEWNET